ncbi:Fibroblast growth factor receptor 2 [Hypsibius exemplaris]|uniref:receptor protein-tyrosine kinase n=1 Tax=Hypsibius exemplaris TaxID=2072580 RepID=A0A1W0WC89_HYPEX|nr:Fibroblast growth factor receptor 2 [Hypsibius exemplaris]
MHLFLPYILGVSTLFVYLPGPAGARPFIAADPTLASPTAYAQVVTTPLHLAHGQDKMLVKCTIPEGMRRKEIRRKDVTWFHNGTRIDRPKISEAFLSFVIKRIQWKDAGTYSCRITNPFGQHFWTNITYLVIDEPDYPVRERDVPIVPDFGLDMNTSTVIIPQSAPRFLFTDRLAFTSEGQFLFQPSGRKMSLPCRAIGNPTPEISWSSNNPFIQSAFFQAENGNLSSYGGVESHDSGIYNCTASNVYGNITYSYEVEIARAPNDLPPRIESDYPKNVTAYLGQPAVFDCKWTSDLNIMISWGRIPRFNGSVRYESEDAEFPISEVLSAKDRRYNLTNPARLIIRNATLNDSGEYFCIVKNTGGEAMRMAFLEVQPKPIPVFDPTRTITIAGIVIGILLFVALLVTLHRCDRNREGKRLAEKKLALGELGPNIRMKRHFKIYRKESQMSDGSLVPSFICEDNGFHPVEYSAANSGSIVTSRATTISHCNSVFEYVDPDRKFASERFEFPRDALVFDAAAPPLGEGAFGQVFKAEALHIKGKEERTIVAVKTPKVDDPDSITNLLSEMEIMAKVTHENVIKLYGCCTQPGDEPLYVIMEYAEHGNLKDFLRASKPNDGYLQPRGVLPLTSRDLLRFSYQIASGVKYLTDKKVLHRDLAARNILVAENFVMKVADFGLSRYVQGHDYYKKQQIQGLLPVKWMAPETMSEEHEYRYSTESDVWSYGVVVWEIMTFGATPYPNMTRPDHITDFLNQGMRLERPQNCSEEVYRLMWDCWMIEPSRRPKFDVILQRLGDLLQLTADYLALGSQSNIFIVNNQEYMETAH